VAAQKTRRVYGRRTPKEPATLAEQFERLTADEKAAPHFLLIIQAAAGDYSMVSRGSREDVEAMAAMAAEFANEVTDEDRERAKQLRREGRLN
jgi:hypothetical protein